ncbi:50S ribosomal protein L23 [Candidatus Chlorohelix sp.]|uniref:50S ribosomal protein L23 n=1 Tax=Candidatus Chlorohelix sp. TaxID=3139201 RepID=UPI003031ACA3
MDMYGIIKRPLITERANDKAAEGIYTFEVDIRANKVQIKEAVEKIFSVEVISVNTMHMHRKQRQRGRIQGYTNTGKKAIVRLKPGDRIEVFEVA